MTKHFHSIIAYILLNIFTIVPLHSSNHLPQRVVAVSPADNVTDRLRFDLHGHFNDLIRRHPALYQLQNDRGEFYPATSPTVESGDSLIHRLYRKTLVSIRHSANRLSGDFLPYEGNDFADTEINADAVYGTTQHGTIFGSASFAKGLHKGYGWNAIRHAELYLPYLIADSTGGDYWYENYWVAGGYSFRAGELYYGLGGSIRGEIAYRQTDPRCVNTSSWLTVDASAALPFGNTSLLALRTSYIRTKQHLHLWNWRPNQQDRFFVTYGFGYYDLQESPVSFGIRRMYYLQGLQTQITYGSGKSEGGRMPVVTADMEYSFMSMKTEESSAKNLFGSDTHHINGSLWLNFGYRNTWNFTAGLQTKNRFRSGRENIYETYRPDENYPSIYDFRQVDTRRRYSSTLSESNVQLKAGYRFLPHLTVEGILGTAVDYRSEGYSSPLHQWAVLSLSPSLGIGAKYDNGRLECGGSVRLLQRIPTHYNYNVDGGEFRLDYQETFLPYAFYTDRSSAFFGEFYMSYPINKRGQRAGIVVNHYLRKGSRPSDVEYTGTPGIVSHLLSHPTNGKVSNGEILFNVTLFVQIN